MKIELGMAATCLRCGKSWQPRKEEVVRCPKCKSCYWNEPLSEVWKRKKCVGK